jgi:tetratricopeptide (TPR) repeat protein
MSVRFGARWIVAVAAGIILVAAGLWWSHLNGAMQRGQRMLIQQRFRDARAEFETCLWLNSNDPAALLAIAEAYARDDDLQSTQAARKAVEHLDRVDEASDIVAKARLQSGRLRLLILKQPRQAELDFLAALDENPASYEANYLMWKLLDLTRRYHLAEPYYSKCLELSVSDQRQFLLYDWYFSQFSTYAAATQFDRQMGFLGADDTSDSLTEYRRLMSFAKNEPDPALNSALLASWSNEFHFEVEEKKWLELAWEKADESTHPYAYAIFFDLMFDAGRFEDAEAVLAAWPEPHTGYDFQKRLGILLAEMKDDLPGAIAACRAALLDWPGPVDWQVHHRLAGLLNRHGDVVEAQQYRDEAERLQKLMEVAFHTKLRELLINGEATDRQRQLAEFYESIGRDADAAAWRSLSRSARQPGSLAE